jgi:pathogenesis-related protein 1
MKIYHLIAAVAAMLFSAPALADMTPAEQQQTLAAHNTERAIIGVNPLQWSPELARFAQQWANELAASGVPRHNPDRNRNNPIKAGAYLGENIVWGGDPELFGPTDWLFEKQWYNHSKDDGFGYKSPPGCTAPAGYTCGHFTQMIAKITQIVGCGKAKSLSETNYIVCDYYPGGNIPGQKPY